MRQLPELSQDKRDRVRTMILDGVETLHDISVAVEISYHDLHYIVTRDGELSKLWEQRWRVRKRKKLELVRRLLIQENFLLAPVAQRLGVSKERVRQIVKGSEYLMQFVKAGRVRRQVATKAMKRATLLVALEQAHFDYHKAAEKLEESATRFRQMCNAVGIRVRGEEVKVLNELAEIKSRLRDELGIETTTDELMKAVVSQSRVTFESVVRDLLAYRKTKLGGDKR